MFTLRLLGSASLEGPDGPVAGRAGLRQRVALLALLAVEHPRPLSRDKLVAYLWPESDTGDARHLLRESLYILRSALGEDSVLSTGDDLRLNPARLSCDLWDFEAALGREDLEHAISQYHGQLLSGFHLSEAEEFEHWVEGERLRLARRYGQALERLAAREMQSGAPVRAVEWWSRLAREDPYNSRIALGYMQALEAAGDRAGALRHASAHADLLRAELDTAPEREVLALAERLRLEPPFVSDRVMPPAPASPIVATLDGDGGDHPQQPVAVEPEGPARRSWVAPIALGFAVVVGIGLLGGKLSHQRAPTLTPERVAAAPFENRTGRPDLDDLGALAADWIVRGVLETPLYNVTDLQAVYTLGQHDRRRPMDALASARQDSAGMVVRGSYYLSGDSVLFQAAVMDVASGRILRSFDPVGAPVQRATEALQTLRERVAAGLSPLINAFNRGSPIDPDLVPPPNLAAYREFVAGLKHSRFDDSDGDADHYRRAARLDTTFIAPLIQLAYRAMFDDQCPVTDSVALVLESRRELLTTWNRLSISAFRVLCQGNVAEGVRLSEQRYRAYPRSASAQAHYAALLGAANRPRAAGEILRRMDPEHDMGWRDSPQEVWPRYWWRLAGSWHALGEYGAELDVTQRWRESASTGWQETHGRALAALGRESDLSSLLGRMAGAPVDSVAAPELAIATELAAHGHSRMARAVAESLLARLDSGEFADWERASNIALADRLLGRAEQERQALERIAGTDADTLMKLEAEGRIAVLLSDTARARRVDSSLAQESDRPLRSPWDRAQEIVARAHIAAGLGRREQAVALLRDASARGLLDLGSSYVFHRDPLLSPLRGYPPFDALLEPHN